MKTVENWGLLRDEKRDGYPLTREYAANGDGAGQVQAAPAAGAHEESDETRAPSDDPPKPPLRRFSRSCPSSHVRPENFSKSTENNFDNSRNNFSEKSENDKPKRGRPKGSRNKATRAIKELIAEHDPARMLIRVMEGRKFMRAGEPGARRTVAVYPTLRESIEAANVLLRKVTPDVKAVELSGPNSGPQEHVHLAGKLDTPELARRVGYVLDLANREKSGGAESDAVADGRAEADSASAGPGPIATTYSDSFGWTDDDGQPVPTPPNGSADPDSGAGEDSHGAASEGREPQEGEVAHLEPGQAAQVGEFVVEAFEGSRAGLPTQHAIRNARGEVVATNPNAGGKFGFAGAVEWVTRRSPDADLMPHLIKRAARSPAFAPVQPDQFTARSRPEKAPDPHVHRRS